MSRNNYLRIFAIGCLDIVWNFPGGLLALILHMRYVIESGHTKFYTGWKLVHSHFNPQLLSTSEWSAVSIDSLIVYYNLVAYPMLSITIFLIFGLTPSARGRYVDWFWIAVHPLGMKPTAHISHNSDMSDIQFSSHPEDQSRPVRLVEVYWLRI